MAGSSGGGVFGRLRKKRKKMAFAEGCRRCSGRLREKKKKNNLVGAGGVWPDAEGGSLATGWKKKIKVGGWRLVLFSSGRGRSLVF